MTTTAFMMTRGQWRAINALWLRGYNNRSLVLSHVAGHDNLNSDDLARLEDIGYVALRNVASGQPVVGVAVVAAGLASLAANRVEIGLTQQGRRWRAEDPYQVTLAGIDAAANTNLVNLIRRGRAVVSALGPLVDAGLIEITNQSTGAVVRSLGPLPPVPDSWSAQATPTGRSVLAQP